MASCSRHAFIHAESRSTTHVVSDWTAACARPHVAIASARSLTQTTTVASSMLAAARRWAHHATQCTTAPPSVAATCRATAAARRRSCALLVWAARNCRRTRRAVLATDEYRRTAAALGDGASDAVPTPRRVGFHPRVRPQRIRCLHSAAIAPCSLR